MCVFFYVLWVCVAHLLSSSCCLLSKITTSLTVKFYFLFLFLCFVFHLFAFSPRSCHSNPANPASKMSSLLCWVVKKKKIKNEIMLLLHKNTLRCAAPPSSSSLHNSLPPSYIRSLPLLCSPFPPPFLPSLPPFSPPILTRVTMPSPGWHTVKLQRQPSATAAQISATSLLGTR